MSEMVYDESMGMWLEDLTMGEMLNWQREIDGLTLKEFETITGISYSLVSRYERDLKKISPKHEEIIANYIGSGYEEEIKQLKQEKQAAIIAARRTIEEIEQS